MKLSSFQVCCPNFIISFLSETHTFTYFLITENQMILSHLLLKAPHKCHTTCMTTHQCNVKNIALPPEFVHYFFLLDTSTLYTQAHPASLSAEVPKTFYQALFSSEGHSVISLGTSSSVRVSEAKARASQGNELPAAPAHSCLQTGGKHRPKQKRQKCHRKRQNWKGAQQGRGPSSLWPACGCIR